MAPELDKPSLLYAITGDLPARRIVQLPSPTEGDLMPFLDMVPAERRGSRMCPRGC